MIGNSNPIETHEPPEMSLMSTIARSDLSALAIEIGEVALDELLADGLLREVPVLSSLVGLTKAGVQIANYLLIRKILRFLYHLEDVSEEKRTQFVDQLRRSGTLKQVGEQLLLLLHRLDDMQKPELVGRVFRAYLEGRIDHRTYRRLCTAVDRISLQSVPGLIDFYQSTDELLHGTFQPDDGTIQDLVICGLVDIGYVPGLITDAQGLKSGPTELGKLFIEIALEKGAT